jgi:hypothetical protein
VNASTFRHKHGNDLIGKNVMTQQIGSYPGGLAKVIEIDPDVDAGIVLQVLHPTFGEIGIFDYEDISFA